MGQREGFELLLIPHQSQELLALGLCSPCVPGTCAALSAMAPPPVQGWRAACHGALSV